MDIDEVQLAQGEPQRAEPLDTRRQPWIAGIVCFYPVDVRGHVYIWVRSGEKSCDGVGI